MRDNGTAPVWQRFASIAPVVYQGDCLLRGQARRGFPGRPRQTYLPGDFKLPLVLRWADMLPGATYLTHCGHVGVDFRRNVETTPLVALASPLAYRFVGTFSLHRV